MPKIYWHYSTMKAGKSLVMLAVRHTYDEQGKKTLLIMPARNNRDGEGVVKSRIGVECKADILVRGYSDIQDIDTEGLSCVFVEEAQFLPDEKCVLALRELAKKVPVMCYGLRTDFRGQLFPAAGWLFAHAHEIREIKMTCAKGGCNQKAMYNMRIDGAGNKIVDGDTVVLGDSYMSVCTRHYDAQPIATPVEKDDAKDSVKSEMGDSKTKV